MSVSLSIKNVPDDLAERLRARAARNRRSLQRELLSILELAAVGGQMTPPAETASPQPDVRLSIEAIAERARVLFPAGTPSSVALIRAMRDGRERELLQRSRVADHRQAR